MSALDAISLSSLVTLLKGTDHDSESDDEKPVARGTAQIGPGNIGQTQVDRSTKDEARVASKDIWDINDVAQESEFVDLSDSRPQPKYEIVYRQSVTTEDMFLQMGAKTPSSASCEEMVVKINLPGSNLTEVQLDVQSVFLDLRTPKYKLGLHLPHPVDDKSGRAEWNSNTSQLLVTLKMKREFDFMNF